MIYLRLGNSACTYPPPSHLGQTVSSRQSSGSVSHSSMPIMSPEGAEGSQPLPPHLGQMSELKMASSNSLVDGIILFSGHISINLIN